jgi:hypothetical protein
MVLANPKHDPCRLPQLLAYSLQIYFAKTQCVPQTPLATWKGQYRLLNEKKKNDKQAV